MIRWLGWRGLIVGVVVGLMVGGAVAWAAIPSSTSGTITACYPKTGTSKGALRVIDYQAGTRCKSGEAMLTWPSKGMRWRNTWLSSVAYSVNDVVRYNGSAYIAKLASTNVVPTTATSWTLMVSKGDTGPAGAPANGNGVSDEETASSNIGWGLYKDMAVTTIDIAAGGPHRVLVTASLSATYDSCTACGSLDVTSAFSLDGNFMLGPSGHTAWDQTLHNVGDSISVSPTTMLTLDPGSHTITLIAGHTKPDKTVTYNRRSIQAVDLGVAP